MANTDFITVKIQHTETTGYLVTITNALDDTTVFMMFCKDFSLAVEKINSVLEEM